MPVEFCLRRVGKLGDVRISEQLSVRFVCTEGSSMEMPGLNWKIEKKVNVFY